MSGGDSFEVVVRHFTAPLFRYCLGQVAGDRALAEDMVQETFLRTYRALMNGRPDDVGAFLFGVARNCCAEARRKAAPREAAPRTEPSSVRLACAPRMSPLAPARNFTPLRRAWVR